LILKGEQDDEVESNLFATEYNPRMVFIGVMIALLLLSIMAIFLGKYLSSRIDRRVITRVAGVVFLLIGLSFLLSAVTSSAFVDAL
jgi:putative Ca2+/H+ antiporter (TMEM165/GDT1 family)